MDERWCYEALRARRWPEGVRCPRCGAARVTVHTRAPRAPRRRYLCLTCRRTFNDRTGTVFARSSLPLRTWFRGLSLLGEGLATAEYARQLSLKWDTARRMSGLLLAASGRPGLVQELSAALVSRTLLLLAAIALAVAPSPAPGAEPSDGLERARGRFLASCAVCHGPEGRADTPVARLLDPRPRNFTDPVEMARVSDDRIYRAITEGRPGTVMAPWSGVPNPEDIRRVVLYIRQAFPPGR